MAEDTYDPRYDFKVPAFGGFDDEHDEDELAKYFEYDHENEIPLDLGGNFSPPTAKRSKQDENAKPLPRRSLRVTPGRQQTANKDSGLKLQEDNIQIDATPQPQKDRRGTLTLETPKEGRRKTRTQSLRSEEPIRQEVKAHDQSMSGVPSNLCTSLASWNKKKKENVPQNKPAMKQPLRNLPQKPPTGKAVLTTEEREMETIKQLREDVAKKRRLAEKSHKRALSSSSAHRPMRSTQVTKVSEFAFATDKRISENKPVTATAEEHKNFTEMLRHYHPIETQHKGPTKPIETNLYTRKRKLTQEPEESAPLWSKTPDRFHSKPRNTKFIPSNRRRRSLSMDCKVTIPVTPKLESQKRARRVNVVSQKELEEKEVEECTSYHFRAQPMNKKIFQSSYCGLPMKNQKEPTVAISPKFATNQRIQQHNNKEDETQMQTSFHARPIPKGMLSGRTGIKEVPTHPATVPHSPAFALKNRMRSSTSSNNSTLSNEDDNIIRANPMPDLNKKFEVKIQKSVVRQEPFSFDTRDKGLPQRRQKLIKEEEIKLEKLRQFHAREPEVLHKAPFVPKASAIPMTEVADIRLNTEIRSTERERFELHKAQIEQELALTKLEKERIQEEEQRKEVERIRRQAERKAQPIRHFKPVQVQKSTVPITVAQSPRFSARLRDRSTHHRNQSMNIST